MLVAAAACRDQVATARGASVFFVRNASLLGSQCAMPRGVCAVAMENSTTVALPFAAPAFRPSPKPDLYCLLPGSLSHPLFGGAGS